jgi:hypothetical protein
MQIDEIEFYVHGVLKAPDRSGGWASPSKSLIRNEAIALSYPGKSLNSAAARCLGGEDASRAEKADQRDGCERGDLERDATAVGPALTWQN